MTDPPAGRRQAVKTVLEGLIEEGTRLRASAREFDALSDDKREAHVQARTRWLADCRTHLRHAGLDDYRSRLDVLIAGTARGPFQFAEVVGLLESAKLATEHGITTIGRMRDFGEILSDMLSLAKEALANNTDGAKNVAAVLTAAAYEDAIRRMGETLADAKERTGLSDVIGSLKRHGILQGAAVSTASGYLKFRNDALHADWEKLDREVVASCLAFTEGLLLKHFA